MFAYCGNNPINRIDPSGNSWIGALIVLGITVVGLLSGCSSQPTTPSTPITPSTETTTTATAAPIDENAQLIVAQTIYGESGGRYQYDDWQDGMLAVATIISNRTDSPQFPNDYISVCTQASQFSGYARGKNIYERGMCDTVMWDYAMSIAQTMVNGGNVLHPLLNEQYLYFHSEKYGNANTISRIKAKEETAIIAGNMFYINWP